MELIVFSVLFVFPFFSVSSESVRFVGLQDPGVGGIIGVAKAGPGECRFSGSAAEWYNFYIELLGLNCTLTLVDGKGTLGEDGNYSGIIGALQRNEADFTLDHHPMVLKGTPTRVGVILTHDFVSILSTFERKGEESANDVDVLQILQSFDALIWSLVLLYTFLLYILLRLSQRYISSGQRQPVALYPVPLQTTGHLLFFPFNQIILLIFTLFIFWVISVYFCNLITTELVTVSKTKVIDSLKDLLESKKRPVFARGWQIIDEFKSGKYPIYRKVWEKVKETGINESLVELNYVKGMDALVDPTTGGALIDYRNALRVIRRVKGVP